MSAAWEIERVAVLPGDDARLAIPDREDGPNGRVVCVVPGYLMKRNGRSGFVRLLDEQDEANARLLAVAPRLRQALVDLVQWSARTGGWEAPCWEEARAILNTSREPPP